MEVVTAYTGQNHIHAVDDAPWHRGIAGLTSFVFNDPELEGFDTNIQSNNEVRIRSGIAANQGRIFRVPINTYDSISIANGTQGENRIDRIVARYTQDGETKLENCEWIVIQGTPTTGTPTAPAYTQGNLDNGDPTNDMPMFQVRLSGLTITSVTPEITVAQTLEDSRISQETIAMFEDAGYPITD